MIASELRQKLFDLIEQYGDLDVVDERDVPVDVEYNDNDGTTPAFVVS